MNDPIKIAQELKDELDKLPLFIEHKSLKKQIENNSELKELKKQIALAKLHNDNELHKSLLDKYNNHPLIVNYQAIEIEVYEYLNQISQIVNKK